MESAPSKVEWERLENEKKAFRQMQERFHRELHATKDDIATLTRLKASHKRRRKHFQEQMKKARRFIEELRRREKAVEAREAAAGERDRKVAMRESEQNLREKRLNELDDRLLRKEENVAIRERQLENERHLEERSDVGSGQVGV
ncbi:MAG: hypothetical protein MOGMAGMI_01968 [Candidatus Omnitrophica bacterium]|nr:hypothetical protein [Candidatus Omnitrophota bacterium]